MHKSPLYSLIAINMVHCFLRDLRALSTQTHIFRVQKPHRVSLLARVQAYVYRVLHYLPDLTASSTILHIYIGSWV